MYNLLLYFSVIFRVSFYERSRVYDVCPNKAGTVLVQKKSDGIPTFVNLLTGLFPTGFRFVGHDLGFIHQKKCNWRLR